MAVHVSSPILIGRSTELERLEAALRQARDGSPAALLVAGEAGVGKTRLVAEFANRAEADGAVVLLGGCIDLGDGGVPYAPVAEALRGLVRRTDADRLETLLGPGRSELARLVPDLGPVADDPPTGLNIGSGQGRLFELLLAVLGRLAADGPVVFIVEDLHWSDRSTRDLLGFLVRNLRDVGVVLVLTYRSDELHRRHPLLPFIAELERSGRVTRLSLEPFDQRDGAAQLRAIAGAELDAELIASIHARSGGNAFFAEELLLAAGVDGRTELPATLRDVLLARVAELSEATQEFLRVASAAGQRVDPTLVAAAMSMDADTLTDALRECVGRQVLVPDRSGLERYAFRHALLQEAVYDDLLPGERIRLHSAFARTLEADPARDPERDDATSSELAYHWYAAHDLPRAFAAAIVAGREAERSYAFPEALAHDERAIDLWDQVPDAAALAGCDLVDLYATAAGVARFQEPARAVALISSAIRLVDEADDPVRRGLLHERLGRCAWIAAQGDLANEAYRTAIRLIPADPPSEARARAVAGLAQVINLGGRFSEAEEFAEEALTLARAVGARDIEGHALNTRGMGRAAAGEVDAGLADLHDALAIAEELGILDDIGRAYANTVWVLDVAGRLDESIAMSARGVATAERLGLRRFFGTHILCNLADGLFQLGRWDESAAALARVADIGPLGVNAILTEELLGRLAMARGQFDEAAAHLRPLVPLAERAVDIQFVRPVYASLAQVALWQGRPDEAAAFAAAAIGQIDFSPEARIGEVFAIGLWANADAAELARARRLPEPESTAVAAGSALLERMRARHAATVAERPVFAHLTEAWLLWCEAEATRLHRRPDPDAWSTAAEAWAVLGRPATVAYARWREAEAVLAARGDRARAAAAIGTALAIAEPMGAVPLANELTALAARARLSIDPSKADGPSADDAGVADEAAHLGLTAREREVLALVALGRTNRQIADELFISENTAGVHVSNILGKLDVAGRGEAAALAYRLGLADTTEPPADR